MELKSKKSDYLKYWRVVRYYVKAKYGVSTADLEMMLFLYSEKYFDRDTFIEFDNLLSWDPKRFQKLLKEEWISVFRKRSGKYKTMYQLSYKAQRMVAMVYEKLNGEEIPVSNSQNPMFLKNVSYTDKRYRAMMQEMNDFIRQERHRVPE
jgi:hypothetical protein